MLQYQDLAFESKKFLKYCQAYCHNYSSYSSDHAADWSFSEKICRFVPVRRSQTNLISGLLSSMMWRHVFGNKFTDAVENSVPFFKVKAKINLSVSTP
jgi:hypothetical protein